MHETGVCAPRASGTTGCTDGPEQGHQVTGLACDLSTALSDQSSLCHREREARAAALENAYVHKVYHQMATHYTCSRRTPWPRVAQFLSDLEPGSIVCDVGCGDGKYMTVNAEAYFIGVDRCRKLATTAHHTTKKQALVCDILRLPFRDECADAVVSVAVIHHLTTTERRVRALRELARILRIGGKLVVTVWAMEQQNRKFESQDVLVPWERARAGSSAGKLSVDEPEPLSTTSDDEQHHYCAYTQTSDSDSSKSHRQNMRRNSKRHRRVRAIDPCNVNSSHSSSDLSSPSETCYSFVRKALQKLAGTHGDDMVTGRPWLASTWSSQTDSKSDRPEDVLATIGAHLIDMSFDNDLCGQEPVPKRRNTLGSDSPSSNRDINLTAFKSHSVGSMWSVLSASIRTSRKLLARPECEPAIPLPSAADVASTLDASDRPKSFAGDCAIDKLVESAGAGAQSLSGGERKNGRKSVTFSTHSLTLPRENAGLHAISEKSKSDSVLNTGLVRRQDGASRVSLTTVQEGDSRDASSSVDAKPVLVRQQCFSSDTSSDGSPGRSAECTSTPVGILKQNSLNENLIRTDRMAERASILSKMRKHRSLNDTMPDQKLNATDSSKTSIFGSYRRLRFLQDSLNKLSASIEKISENDNVGSSIKNGLAKIMKHWTDVTAGSDESSAQDASKTGSKRGPPNPAFVGSDYRDKDAVTVNTNCMSPPETDDPCVLHRLGTSEQLRRNSAVEEKQHLYKYLSRERKTSRDESSDSSKENSFQSDTSLDSEDSCVSVIYVPRADDNKKERSRSVSSESSDDKQLSPKSPHTLPAPASPTRVSAGAIAHPAHMPAAKLFSSNCSKACSSQLRTLAPVAAAVFPKVRERSSTITCFDSRFGAGGYESLRDKFLLRSNSLDSSGVCQSDAAKLTANRDGGDAKRLAAFNNTSKYSQQMADAVKSTCALSDKIDSSGCDVREARSTVARGKLFGSVTTQQPSSPYPVNATGGHFDFPPARIGTVNGTSSQDQISDLHKAPAGEKRPPLKAAAAVVTATPGQTSAGPGDGSGDATPLHCCDPRPCKVEHDVSGNVSSQLSTLVMDENIEIIRRPGAKSICNVHVIHKPLPNYLSFEVYNPETDDLDSESSCTSGSSSPNSACSVVSLSADWSCTQTPLLPSSDTLLSSNTVQYSALHQHRVSANELLGVKMGGASSSAVSGELFTHHLQPPFSSSSAPPPPSPPPPSPATTAPPPAAAAAAAGGGGSADTRNSLSPTCGGRSSQSPSPTDSLIGRSVPLAAGATAAAPPTSPDCHQRHRSRSACDTAGSGHTTATAAASVTGAAAGDSGEAVCRQSTSPRGSRSRKLGVSRLDPFLLEQVVEESDWQLGGGEPGSCEQLVSSVSSASSLSEGGESWHRRSCHWESATGGRAAATAAAAGGGGGSSSASLVESDRALSPELSSTAPSSDSEQGAGPCHVFSAEAAAHRCVTARAPFCTPAAHSSSRPGPSPCRPGRQLRQTAAGADDKRAPAGAKSGDDQSERSGATSSDGSPLNRHRYYHVFHEGELDSLIERYVDSLHIISSYYDHANWCIVAEKVQVWTI